MVDNKGINSEIDEIILKAIIDIRGKDRRKNGRELWSLYERYKRQIIKALDEAESSVSDKDKACRKLLDAIGL